MIELLWICIAALGCWNVYAGTKRENFQDTTLQWELKAGPSIVELQTTLKAETAKREALEEMIGKYIATPQPVMLNMEGIHQAMCEIQARQCDPDYIFRQAEGKDWEGGCGHN